MSRRIFLIIIPMMVLSLACSITLIDTPAAPPAPPQVVTQIVVVPGDTATLAPPPTDALPTSTSQVLPTLTSLPSPTATSAFPIARLIKDANCRTGPGTAYVTVTSFLKGQALEIVGRNPDFNNTWWLVKIPGTNSKCWISLTTAQATGDFESIPIIYPPY